jgi:hypothetical protein
MREVKSFMGSLYYTKDVIVGGWYAWAQDGKKVGA